MLHVANRAGGIGILRLTEVAKSKTQQKENPGMAVTQLSPHRVKITPTHRENPKWQIQSMLWVQRDIEAETDT